MKDSLTDVMRELFLIEQASVLAVLMVLMMVYLKVAMMELPMDKYLAAQKAMMMVVQLVYLMVALLVVAWVMMMVAMRE